MKLNNGSKIIHENDIIMSDGQNNLSDIISAQENKISRLESNLKWIYKYGGIGGGGGSQGGGSSQTFSIFASLNDIQLKDQSIVLDGVGLYPLNIKINNPNGASFNVKFTYSTKTGAGNDIKQEQTVILSIENNYEFSTKINLNTNSTLQITVSDGNEVKQVMCNYITTPYEFKLSLIDDDGNPVSEEHFIENAAQKGVNVQLTYVISVPANINYEYTFGTQSVHGDITDKNNSILFPIEKSLFVPKNAGFYSANINLKVIPDGQKMIQVNKSISFSLIPEGLYMLIQPYSGIIYDTPTDAGVEYTPGYIEFKYRIYEGISQNRTYHVVIKLNGEPYIEKDVVERQQDNFKLLATKTGENNIEIQVTRASTYKKTYYFYIQNNELKLDWFDNTSEWTQYYYRINEVSNNFQEYKNKICIEQTINSSPIKIGGISAPNVSANGLINTHIAVGLQYNSINDEDPVILNFYNNDSGSAPVLTIQQSKITRTGQEAKLYIRKQSKCDKDIINNYHLIQVYSQYIRRIGNDFYYEVSLYIDGILENVFGQITGYPLLIDSLQIEPVNCYINLLDIDFKKTDEEIENTNPSNCDYDVYKYFLKYKNSILRQDVGEELLLTDYLKNFKVGLDGRVVIDQASINNIASNINTPVLLMTYEDDGGFDSRNGFMNALEANYGEDGTITGGDMSFQVKLEWSPGKNQVQEIQFPSEFQNARFIMKLQGSSTKAYRVKNFTARLENTTGTEQDEVYLFSPNFSDEDSSTFLPETEFTLKADIVDSSHSNNTSCGKFINTVCKKFSDYMPEDNYYKKYIKNCLEGFPFLLFLTHVYTDSITGEEHRDSYYLGVYNFNLGRSSYYNLGYKDLSVFGNASNKLLNNAGNSFSFFKINPSQDLLKPGLGVAEIQGGDPHFDFSQWDPSLLFQQKDTDSRYMFGDLVMGSNGTEEQLKNAISQFVQKVAKSGGYIFDFLKKVKGPYETDDVINKGAGYNAEVYDSLGNPTGESKNQVPDYSIQYVKYLSPSGSWELKPKEGPKISGSIQDLRRLVIPDIDSGIQASLNFQSIAEYYTICMVLGLVDSVMKNLNIKSWNINPSNGEATWFPAFYDMDTCLGINNQGNPISYFAYSDYWHSQVEKTINGVEYPLPVKIYRDFSPHSLGENGYDVPTNYLFTVAKYTKIIYPDSDASLAVLDKFPQELYANWRSNVENHTTNSGVLKNADMFMQNFFTNNLAAICPALVSYNYRSKYLKLATKTDTIWISTDFNKFNGTRINSVRDWLEGRLHILDIYFGLNKQMVQPITYRTENGTWETLYQGSSPVVEPLYQGNYQLENNEDIVILKDIFSANGGAGVQLAGNVSFQIQCPEFSPLQIYNPVGFRRNYILGGENKQQVQFTTTGTQAFKLGGSQAWTYLQNINWIATEALYITSDKLQNITGTSGKFTSLQLHTPNVKTIQLTSSNYSGLLNLNGISNYPNLHSIDISGSKIGLTVDGLNIKNLNISNMNAPTANVQIKNCEYLTSLNTTNTKLKSLTILGLKGKLKDITLNTTNINSINISGGEPGGRFILENDNTVESVTISNFQTVQIRHCPNLTKVILSSGEIQDIEDLQIYYCGADNIAISSEPEYHAGKVTIGNSKIKKVYFRETTGIQHVELPDGVQLWYEAFCHCGKLQTVSGHNIGLDYGAFRDCTQYALKDKNGDMTDFKVSSIRDNLSYAFAGTAATWEDVKTIIDNVIPTNNSIKYVNHMFYYCPKIKFGLNELINSYKQNDYPNFGKLNKVINASCMFYNYYGNGICAVNKKFMEMGSSAGCNYQQAFANQDSARNFYVPKDIFKGSIHKIIKPLFGNDLGIPQRVIFTNTDGNPLSVSQDIKMSEIFNPDGQSPGKLTTLYGISPYENYIFDWTDTFTAGWKSLNTVSLVCSKYMCKYKGYSKLFYNVPNPVRIDESFNLSGLEEETADYYTMYNWDKQCQQSVIFTVDLNLQTNTKCNNCRKYISVNNYKLLCEKILQSTKITSINVLFRNVTVIGALGEWTLGTSINKNIKSAYMAFSEFTNKTSEQQVDNNYLMLSPDFCNPLPALTNVLGMFRYCKLGKPIPFNFFKKRKIIENKDIYVRDEEDSYKQATLYTSEYINDMINMSYLFEHCTWANDCLQYDPSLYTIPKNRVTDGERDYTTYYIKNVIPPSSPSESESYVYTEYTVEQPTEITDAENLHGGYISQVANTSITNPIINGDTNKLIIPPDLFYGLLPQINDIYSQGVYRALACSSVLNGIIPEHIFKYNKTVRCDQLWEGNIIIPRLVKTWEDSNTTTNVYVHFPSGYTEYPNLQNAFNAEYIVLENTSIDTKTTINYSFVLLEDSIAKNTQSLSRAFSSATRWAEFGQRLTTNRHQFNFFGKLNGNSIIHGINPSIFTNLNMNQMFYSPYLQAINGNLFDTSFNAKYLKLSNKTDYVMYCDGLNGFTHPALATSLILPMTDGNISQLAPYNVFNVKSNQILEIDKSRKYYENAGWTIVE